jgi:hypothetical protein
MSIALVLLAAVLAQEATIDADRPHVGTGTHVVPPGEVQVEMGMQWQGSPDIRTFGSPVLIRVGVSDRVEARASSDGLLARHEPTWDVYGIGNAQLGAKIRLYGEPEEPVFSIMPMLGFGLASREKHLGAGATDATLTWLAGHPIGRVHLEANYGTTASARSAMPTATSRSTWRPAPSFTRRRRGFRPTWKPRGGRSRNGAGRPSASSTTV